MHFNPEESSQAHTQMIGHRDYAAASSSSHHQDSQADCDLRGPPLVSCERGEDTSQHSRPLGVSRAERVTSVPLLQRRQLEHAFARSSAPNPLAVKPPPSWTTIGVGILSVIALWVFLFALDGGLIR